MSAFTGPVEALFPPAALIVLPLTDRSSSGSTSRRLSALFSRDIIQLPFY